MESLNHKISVITICYNCREDLERTVRSVLAQTVASIEYIIVDGGSNDGTMEMLKSYIHDIDVVISEPDNGIYDALNKGVKRATGDWIICMNAGDTFTSDDILSCIFSQEIDAETAVLYSDFYLCQENGEKILRKTDRTIGEIHHQNMIYRRLLHDQYGYYIVTHPYIVSDLLFFLAIPAAAYKKVDTPIANVKAGGISDAQWSAEQAWAAKVIYGIETIPGIFRKYVSSHIHLLIRKLLRHER